MATPTLARLAEEVALHLNSSQENWWGDGFGVGPGRFIEAQVALDPSTMLELEKMGLWVVPTVVTYSREESQGRRKIVSLHRSPIISLCLSIPFETDDGFKIDVGSWEEVRKILNLRELIDLYVLSNKWDANIVEIDSEPAQDVQMKYRWFLSVTEITFGEMTCASTFVS